MKVADILLLGATLVAAQPVPSLVVQPAQYVNTALIAILPGNPNGVRFYSLSRTVLTNKLFGRLIEENNLYSESRPARSVPVTEMLKSNLDVNFLRSSEFTITFFHPESATALKVVNTVTVEFLNEVGRRRAIDAKYGKLRISVSPHRIESDGRSGQQTTLAFEGLAWTALQRRQAGANLETVRARILDREVLLDGLRQAKVVRDSHSAAEIEAILRDTRDSLTFKATSDSFLQVSYTTRNRFRLKTVLPVLLASAQKGDAVKLDRVISSQDLDFVPVEMRRGWYVFKAETIDSNGGLW